MSTEKVLKMVFPAALGTIAGIVLMQNVVGHNGLPYVIAYWLVLMVKNFVDSYYEGMR